MRENEIKESFANIYSFGNSKNEKIEHGERMIMFRFLSEIEKLMQEKGLNKKELGKKIGTSASYITQLFRGDKVINLHTLAKIEVEFERSFNIKLVKEGEERIFGLDEDELIKSLNEKNSNAGCWIFHSYKKTSIPSNTSYSESEDFSELESISNG